MKKLLIFSILIFVFINILISSTIMVLVTPVFSKNNTQTELDPDVPPIVLRFAPRISDELKKYSNLNVGEHLPILLAIIMQESGGNAEKTPDIFQCSESLGLRPNSISTEESIVQGVKYFSHLIDILNKEKIKDIKYAVQAYNFGEQFLYDTSKKGRQEIPFEKSYAEEFANSKGGKYGDINYVENVFRFLKVTNPVPVEGQFKVSPIVSDSIAFLQPYGEYTDGSGKHYGIDIGDRFGSIIVSVDDGIIDSIIGGDISDNLGNPPIPGSYGNCVTIKHANGLYTRYAHLKKNSISVKKGDKVKAGDRIGLQGDSGTSYGTHLHFEVRVHGGYKHEDTRNPEEYIKIKYNNR